MLIEGWIIYTALAIEIVILCLLLGLLYVYWGSYKKVKSKFTIGLIFFTSTFLLKSILLIAIIIAFIMFPFPNVADGHDGPPIALVFLVNIIECIALAILLKISWK